MFVYILYGCKPPSLLALGWSCFCTAGAPDKVDGITTKNSDLTPVTTAETTDVGNAWTPKSCLCAGNAPSEGHTVTFKESLLKFHFYYYPDPDDIWSRCGLSMCPTCKSFTPILLIFGDSPASHSQPPTSYLLSKGSPCHIDWIQAGAVFFLATRAFVTTFTYYSHIRSCILECVAFLNIWFRVPCYRIGVLNQSLCLSSSIFGYCETRHSKAKKAHGGLRRSQVKPTV